MFPSLLVFVCFGLNKCNIGGVLNFSFSCLNAATSFWPIWNAFSFFKRLDKSADMTAKYTVFLKWKFKQRRGSMAHKTAITSLINKTRNLKS